MESKVENENCIRRDVSRLFSFHFLRKKWIEKDGSIFEAQVWSGVSALKLRSQRQLVHQREFLVGDIFRMGKVGETIV